MAFCAACGKKVPDNSKYCVRCGKERGSISDMNAETVAADVIQELSPFEKFKARIIFGLAKKVEPSPAQRKEINSIDENTTWRDLGFDIDEAPKTPGTFASKKQFDIWCKRSDRAIRLEKAGKIDEAIALYEKGVSENTELPGDYHRLSVIYSKRGELEKAIGYCDLALKSPACTNPAQDVARRDFRERKKKLEAQLRTKGLKR